MPRPSARQLAALAALIVPLGWLAWLIVADTAGHVLAKSNPAAALRWNPDEPDALVALTERRLVAPPKPDTPTTPTMRPATATELAADGARLKRALRERPLDSHALALLGLVAYRQREAGRGNALIAMAGRLSWRDPLAQTMLAGELSQTRRYEQSLAHVDAVLRTHPNMKKTLFPSLTAFSATAEGWRAVGRFLAADEPAWRLAFLDFLCSHLRSRTRLTQLYDELAASKAPPTNRELKPLLRRLVADGLFVQAHRLWQRMSPGDRKAMASHPYNGDFAHKPSNLPFDWTFLPTRGVDMRIVDAPNAHGKALRVEFSGARVDFRGRVRQLMLLPPGSYDFTVKARANGLHTHRGLWWRIDCAGDAQRSLGHTKLVAGTIPWSSIDMAFTVPAQGCVAQWLTIALPARFNFERQIGGQAWFADAQIHPINKAAGQ